MTKASKLCGPLLEGREKYTYKYVLKKVTCFPDVTHENVPLKY